MKNAPRCFDLCGLYDMQALGYNLPNKSITNPVDLALINLSLYLSDQILPLFHIMASSILSKQIFSLRKTLATACFSKCIFPCDTWIHDIYFDDLSPNDSVYPNVNTPQWQTFLALYPTAFVNDSISIMRHR